MSLQKQPAHLPKCVYDKMQNDHAPETVLNGLLTACETVAEDAIANTVDNYCRGKELCGPDVELETNERLGHVKPEKRTVTHIANILRMDPAEIGHLFQGLAGEGTQTEIDLARDWFMNEIVNGPGSRIAVARRPAWLFRTIDHVSDPFAGDISCLPWCLGLPLWAKTSDRAPPRSEVACLGYRLAAASVALAKMPTLIDAGFEAAAYYWHPGGKTMPHAHGPSACTEKFEELVVEPPFLASIEYPVIRFKSKSI